MVISIRLYIFLFPIHLHSSNPSLITPWRRYPRHRGARAQDELFKKDKLDAARKHYPSPHIIHICTRILNPAKGCYWKESRHRAENCLSKAKRGGDKQSNLLANNSRSDEASTLSLKRNASSTKMFSFCRVFYVYIGAFIVNTRSGSQIPHIGLKILLVIFFFGG